MSDSKAWALIANGGLARIIKNPFSDSNYQVIELDAGQVKTGGFMSDRPGRSFASVGKSRSGLELHSDPIRNQERLFAERLSDYLVDNLDQGNMDSLYVAASPRTLGDLRTAFPARLRNRVINETDKDFTGLSMPKLKQAILKLSR